MTPELTAVAIAAGGLALLFAGWRMEVASLPAPATEGNDDGAEALPAEDL